MPRDVSLSDSKCWNGGHEWVNVGGNPLGVAVPGQLLFIIIVIYLCINIYNMYIYLNKYIIYLFIIY